MKVVLFLPIIRIIKEIRTAKTRRQADFKRPTIGVRIYSLKSSQLSAIFNCFVNNLMMLVGMEI